MGTYSDDSHALVADIGGTNTRVALARGARLLPDSVQRYRNAEFPGLEPVLQRYIAGADAVECAGACVAVAGPVRGGVAEMTNLNWTIDADMLTRVTGAGHVAILNDLQAQGYAVGILDAARLRPILKGEASRPAAARLVIGIGTGFNAAAVFEGRGGRIVPPSESGHVGLPVRTEAELRLCRHVEATHGFPAVEEVLSGRGLERIYRWLGDAADDPRDLSAAGIMVALDAGDDPRASEAVRMFVSLLGNVTGNLALIHLPFGGIYLIGGVARAMAAHLDRFGFAAAFRDKGRFAGFMDNFPVSVIEDDFAALIGCASHLAETA